MATRERRLSRIRSNPKNVRFDDLRRVLEDFGFRIRKGKGSHAVAFHPGTGRTLTLVSARPVKRVYVMEALDAIEEVEFHER